jgi:hypothetical protein
MPQTKFKTKYSRKIPVLETRLKTQEIMGKPLLVACGAA